MPVYVNQQAQANLFNDGTGAYYPLAGDLAGNTYIRQSMFPASLFTFSNITTKNIPWTVAGTAPVSGTMWATPVYLPGGFSVQNITFVSGTTAGGTLTHQWFGLMNAAGAQIVTTADDTSTAWAASTAKTLAVAKVNGATAAAYLVPQTTVPGSAVLHWATFLVAATTVPTLHCVTTSTYAATAVPASGSTDQTSKTTPILTDGTVSPAITPNSLVPWVGIS